MKTSASLVFLTITILSGCSTIPSDSGRSDVNQMVLDRGGPDTGELSQQATMDLVASLTAEPLTVEKAIRIALVNNPRLQASFAELGFAAADVYEAGRIRNPVLSASVLESSVAGAANQVTLGLALSFSDLLTLPARKRMSESAFLETRLSTGAAVMQTAAATEQAWYRYVGARQMEAMREQIALAAGASSELASRFYSAGNINAHDLAMQRAESSEARLELLDARTQSMIARTDLATLMGLSSAAAWSTPAELLSPPESEDDLDELLALAMSSRLDLAAVRAHADLEADRLGVVNWTRWLGEFEVGFERERESDGSYLTGPGMAWEIPVFTQNRDQQLRAEASLKMAVAEVQGLMVEVDNRVRLEHARVLNARARIAEYQDELIPQRIEASARAQEEVNFMLKGVFELLAIKQAEYAAYEDYLQAVRDYWLARTELQLAVGNALPGDGDESLRSISTDQLLQSSSPGADHSGHEEIDHSGHSKMDHSKHQEMNKPMPESMHQSSSKEPTDSKLHPHHNTQQGDQP